MNLRPFTHYLRLFARYLKPQMPATVSMTLLLLVSIGLQLLNPLILRSFIDTIRVHGFSTVLFTAAFLYLGVSLLNEGVSVVANYLSEKVAWTATNHMRADLLAHILTLDLKFHQSHTSGELLERIDGDVDELSNFFSQMLVQMLFHAALLLAMLIALTCVNWILGLALGLYTIVVVVAVVWLRRPVAAQRIKWREADALFFGFLSEQLAGREDINANGARNYVMHRFAQLYHSWFVTIKKAGLTGSTPWILSQAMYALGGILGLVLGAYLWSIGLATPGTVYVIFAYSSLLTKPLDQMLWQIQDLQQAEACIQRIQELFQTTSNVQDGEGLEPGKGRHTLTFDRVSFGYTEGEPILHDLSFVLPAGHVLGVLGRTGAGKTTLVRLLFRMYDSQSGTIRLGDVDLRQMKLQDLRKRIGLITQEVQLFHASVRDNLTFFNQAIDDEKILNALREIGLADWYESLAKGLDTILSPDGSGLSAGEAQLLAFARVFLSDPDLVILDEASSRLDPATEQTMKRAMVKLFANRTGLIIAHRLATIQWVSDIMVIEKGRIVEYAPRAELAANPNSQFAQLLRHDLGVKNP
ncbi:MAG TPA: ABC transporter ATP-binding protein [Ktedonobacteraceae bacterium]